MKMLEPTFDSEYAVSLEECSLDLNTRVDILLLGVIAGSESVGIYSIGSLFAEGLYQLTMVPRCTYDPVVTHLIVEERHTLN